MVSVGKWYYSSDSAEFKSASSFKAVEPPHIKVHDCANKAVEAVKMNNIDQAKDLRDCAVKASEEVMDRLDELAEHLRHSVGV
jgi:hypothetical protein